MPAIQGKEILSDDLIKRHNELIKLMDKLLSQTKQYVAEGQKISRALSSTQAEKYNSAIKKVGTNTRQLTAYQKQQRTVFRQLEQTKARMTSLETKRGQELVRVKVREAEARKQARIQAQKEIGIYKKVSGVFRGIGRQLVTMAGAYIGVMGVIKLVGGTIKTLKNFEKAMDEVSAITGATSEEFKQLERDAMRLGSSTSKTASEVAGLQKEFAKLGFSTQEILDATEATINLSIASGSDLAESAVVAASTVRGFGLAADETGRVTDVMAKSFSNSALDLEKFKTAMGIVAPVAKNANVSIERSTALLSILSDAGVDASTAGTSLRNIFLELSKQGITWNDAMNRINSATDKNAVALELFGKRGATVASILATNSEKADKLTVSYENSAGAAEHMAKVMEDNLEGDLKRLSSAWEGLMLSMKKQDGALRPIIQGFTKLLNNITKLTTLKYSEQLKEERKEMNKLVDQITLTNIGEGKRVELITKLNEKYPEFLKGLDKEKVTNQQLVGRLQQVNEAYLNKIIIAEKEELIQKELDKLSRKANQATHEQIVLQNKLSYFKDKINALGLKKISIDEQGNKVIDNFNIREVTLSQTLEGQVKTISSYLKKYPELMEYYSDATNSVTRLEKTYGLYQKRVAQMEKQQDIYNQAEEKGNTIIEIKRDLLKQLGFSLDEYKEGVNDVVTVVEEAEEAEENAIKKRVDYEKEAFNFLEKLLLERTNKINDSYDDERMTAEEALEDERLIRSANLDIEEKYLIEKARLFQQWKNGRIEQQEDLYNRLEELDAEYAEKRADYEMTSLQKTAINVDEFVNEHREKFQIVEGLADNLYNYQSQIYNNELRDLDEKNRKGILSDEEYARKSAAIKEKQLKLDIAAGVVKATIDTFLAVNRTIANFGVPLGLIFGAIALASGLGNVASIAKQKIPAYAEGTEDHKGGKAIVGDAGKKELGILPDGNVFVTPDKPTLIDIPKGTIIKPDVKEVDSMLTYTGQQVSDNKVRMPDKLDLHIYHDYGYVQRRQLQLRKYAAVKART